MSWTETAEEFVGKHGFGARGKHISLSRILNPSDLAQLQTSQFVCAYRPRGILSGFLVIHPQLQYAVYLPPAASKLQPQRLHMRVDARHMEHGVIASAYLYNKQLVVEDLVAIDGVTVWLSRGFSDRWARLKQFFESEMRQDVLLQGGITIACTSYMSLGSAAEPPDDKVMEFVPCGGGGGGQKRMIWIPDRAAAAAAAKTAEPAIGAGGGGGGGGGKVLTAKREAGMGPDVYSLYDGDTKLGTALVRTLAASRALRLAFVGGVDSVRASVQFVKQFDKWEVLDVVAP